MTFAHPWFLLLLLLLPVLAWLRGRHGMQSAFLYSSVQLVKPVANLSRWNAGRVLLALRWLALGLFIVGLARPQWVESETTVRASGVDIVVAFDMSGSMDAMDFRLKGQEASRLDLAKEVLEQFIGKRPNDRIGLVAFGGRPYLAAPLTLDHDFLCRQLQRLDSGTVQERNTAIGSALMAALNRLRELKSRSKIVILMTDGRNNAGKVPPLTAAEAAEALGVKAYTIGVGKRGDSYIYVPGPFGGRHKQIIQEDLDEETLQKLAARTGGKYYRADNAERFRQIYDEIDKLEKTEVETKKYVRIEELFHWPVVPGAFFLLLEILLGNTVWRRLP
jgi:Ca-activated chloride channel family protein